MIKSLTIFATYWTPEKVQKYYNLIPKLDNAFLMHTGQNWFVELGVSHDPKEFHFRARSDVKILSICFNSAK
jgi:hypothetical protein